MTRAARVAILLALSGAAAGFRLEVDRGSRADQGAPVGERRLSEATFFNRFLAMVVTPLVLLCFILVYSLVKELRIRQRRARATAVGEAAVADAARGICRAIHVQ